MPTTRTKRIIQVTVIAKKGQNSHLHYLALLLFKEHSTLKCAGKWRTLLDFIVEERACCRFFTFELTFPAPHDTLWLTLSGGDTVKDLIGAMFPRIIAQQSEAGADGKALDPAAES